MKERENAKMQRQNQGPTDSRQHHRLAGHRKQKTESQGRNMHNTKLTQAKPPKPTKKAKPAIYSDIWLITYNTCPPAGTTTPQLAVITAADHMQRNYAAMRRYERTKKPITWDNWRVIGIAFSQPEAENMRHGLDQTLRALVEGTHP